MRSDCRPGISILEFLIYLLLVSFFMALCFQWLVATSTSAYRLLDRADQRGKIFMTHDLLAQDIRAASCLLADWHKKDLTHILWADGHGAISWQYDKGNLYRKTGIYNAKKQTWTKGNTNVVLQGIKECRFVVAGRQGVRGPELMDVVCTISMNTGAQEYITDHMMTEQRIWHKEDLH